MTDEEQYLLSVAVSANNGICAVIQVLARNGLMNRDELRFIHDAMVKPYTLAVNSNNPLIATALANLDGLISEFDAIIEKRTKPT